MTFLRRLFRDRIAALMADHNTREAEEQRIRGEQPTGFVRFDGEVSPEFLERLKAALHERAEQVFPDGGDKFDARRR